MCILAVGVSEEVTEIPLARRLLGEDLVLFRDGRGRLGLLGLHCPHRGTSLEYGDIEADGLRCPYHSWAFDVNGHCYDQPLESEGSTFLSEGPPFIISCTGKGGSYLRLFRF